MSGKERSRQEKIALGLLAAYLGCRTIAGLDNRLTWPWYVTFPALIVGLALVVRVALANAVE